MVVAGFDYIGDGIAIFRDQSESTRIGGSERPCTGKP